MTSSYANHLPKVLSPNMVTLMVRASTYEVWEDMDIQVINRKNQGREKMGQ